MTSPEPIPVFPYVFVDETTDRMRRLPGATFVAVDFYCKVCWPTRRRLARFGRNTYPGAGDQRDWQLTWHKNGVVRHSPWIVRPDGTDAVALFCDQCKHTPDPVRREWILALLDNVKPADDGYGADPVLV